MELGGANTSYCSYRHDPRLDWALDRYILPQIVHCYDLVWLVGMTGGPVQAIQLAE